MGKKKTELEPLPHIGTSEPRTVTLPHYVPAAEQEPEATEDLELAPTQVKLVGLVRAGKLGSLPGYKIVSVLLDANGDISDVDISKQMYLIQEAKHRVERALEDAVREARRG